MTHNAKYKIGMDFTLFEDCMMSRLKKSEAKVFSAFVKKAVEYEARMSIPTYNFDQLVKDTGLKDQKVRYIVKKLAAKKLIIKTSPGNSRPMTYRLFTAWHRNHVFNLKRKAEVAKVKYLEAVNMQHAILGRVKLAQAKLKEIEKELMAHPNFDDLVHLDFVYPIEETVLEGE